MKITYLKDSTEAWPYFYDFCVKSKPYHYCSLPSHHLRDKKIKANFDEFSSRIVYKAEDKGKVMGFVFLQEEEHCLDVNFLFGVRKNFTSPRLILAAHTIFEDALKKYNKNYLKSQIRRTFKVKSYKKWIERYDNKAIILNDPQNTVVWCNSEKMSVIFKVVGANKTTEHLMGKEAAMESVRKGLRSKIREMIIENQTYLFDEKSVDFLPDRVLIHGLLSDDKENVGRIAFEFKPQKLA
jgi:hypothetical protein